MPKLGANECLRTVEKTFMHVHANRQMSGSAAFSQARQQSRFDSQVGCAINSQGFVGPRYDKDEPDMRISQDILQSKDQLVSLAIRNSQGNLVLDRNKAGAAAFRR